MATPGKETENGVYQFPDKKKPQTNWEHFCTSIYNSDTKEFLGRTRKNWGQLLTFYTIFYVFLAALFAICMEGLLATIDDNEPTWTLDSGLIGTNPGLGFRPISNHTEDGSLIWYNTTNPRTGQKWISYLDEFLAPYAAEMGKNPNQIPCDFAVRPRENQSCLVDTSLFGPCGPQHQYGYNTMSPCIFLKLNKIFGWLPQIYNSSDLPEAMPETLKDRIMNAKSQNQSEQVWVSCKGFQPSDRENLMHGFRYFPSSGFPIYHYPYRNVKGYLSPLVAVQINDPTPNVIISIECRAWAKNINYYGGSQDRREGSVTFEVMIDV